MALGVGLLVGAERERRKQSGSGRAAAGIRTFAAASLAGACSLIVGGAVGLAAILAIVGGLAAAAYWRNRNDDPGLTTELALVLVALIGALSVNQPTLGAGLGVTVAVLLAARTPLHHFVRSVLSEDEARDGLVLATATLVVLPLLPNRALGPFDAINLRALGIVVVLVLSVGALGRVAVRTFGARLGLPLAGLASGFVSAAATVGAMGSRSRQPGTPVGPPVAAAVLSTVATVFQMAIVVGSISTATLVALAPPLLCAGAAAATYAGAFAAVAVKGGEAPAQPVGQVFSLPTALGFAGLLGFVALATAAMRAWFGEGGLLAVAALAGLADAHAAAASIATLVAGHQAEAADATAPILAGLTANTLVKIIVAVMLGSRPFALRVVPGLILVGAAAWAGYAAPRLGALSSSNASAPACRRADQMIVRAALALDQGEAAASDLEWMDPLGGAIPGERPHDLSS